MDGANIEGFIQKLNEIKDVSAEIIGKGKIRVCVRCEDCPNNKICEVFLYPEQKSAIFNFIDSVLERNKKVNLKISKEDNKNNRINPKL